LSDKLPACRRLQRRGFYKAISLCPERRQAGSLSDIQDVEHRRGGAEKEREDAISSVSLYAFLTDVEVLCHPLRSCFLTDCYAQPHSRRPVFIGVFASVETNHIKERRQQSSPPRLRLFLAPSLQLTLPVGQLWLLARNERLVTAGLAYPQSKASRPVNAACPWLLACR